MLEHTILAALNANLFDEIVLSTDDDEAGEIGRKYGLVVESRKKHLANDEAKLITVVQDVLSRRKSVDEVALLLVNCPLRSSVDILNSHRYFLQRRPAALITVVNYGWTPPQRAQFMNDGYLTPVFEDQYLLKGQEFREFVCPSGAVFWSTPECIRGSTSLYVSGIVGYQIPWHRGIDIDTREDFLLAQAIYGAKLDETEN